MVYLFITFGPDMEEKFVKIVSLLNEIQCIVGVEVL